MKHVSENLIVVTRPTAEGSLEVLTGEKQRGQFAGKRVFPGGKTEGAEPLHAAAIRELGEEVGIHVNSVTDLGRLIVHDSRPGRQRFGNVWLHQAQVDPGTEAVDTPELAHTRWDLIDDVSLTDQMPLDVGIWWPAIRNTLISERKEIIVHIRHDEGGNGHIVVKHPDFAHMPGRLLHQEELHDS